MGCEPVPDAATISAPSSTKNAAKEEAPEMHQTRKGRQWRQASSVNVEALLVGTKVKPTAWSGDVPLFDFSDSKQLLGQCERLGVGVLGVEGFELLDDGLRPDMDHIADFSRLLESGNFEVESVRWAGLFLEMAKDAPHLLFEYVLASRDDRR